MKLVNNRTSCALGLLVSSTANTNAFSIMSKFRNDAFQSIPTSFTPNAFNSAARSLRGTELFYYEREADRMEQFVGGVRYEMVELPDCLVDTTIFVGNLCEFVTDEMLSEVFRKASTLNFVPAYVARKPNSSSLKYGFVTFPTVEEKEMAIVKFSGYLLNDRPMRVESIIDYEYRVRVPEQLLLYTVGETKKTRDGTRNTMRMAQNSREQPKRKKKDRKSFRNGGSHERGKRKKVQRRKNRRNNVNLSSWSM